MDRKEKQCFKNNGREARLVDIFNLKEFYAAKIQTYILYVSTSVVATPTVKLGTEIIFSF